MTRKPYQINSCHIYDEAGPEVKRRWPQYVSSAEANATNKASGT